MKGRELGHREEGNWDMKGRELGHREEGNWDMKGKESGNEGLFVFRC